MKQNGTGAEPRDAGKVFLNLVTGACLFFCFALIANNIYPTRQSLSEMQEKQADLEREIAERHDRIRELNLRGDALESDAYFIDRTKRRIFRSPGEDELMIRIVDEHD